MKQFSVLVFLLVSFLISKSQIEIINPGPVCVNNGNVFFDVLDSNNRGGIWFGRGVVDSVSGEFSPSMSGAGLVEIKYQLNDLETKFEIRVYDIHINDVIGPSTFCVGAHHTFDPYYGKAWEWQDGSTDRSYSVYGSEENEYNVWVKVFDENGCYYVDSAKAIATRVRKSFLPKDVMICNDSIFIDAGEGTNLIWSDGDTLRRKWLHSNTNYHVEKKMEYGCLILDSVKVSSKLEENVCDSLVHVQGWVYLDNPSNGQYDNSDDPLPMIQLKLRGSNQIVSSDKHGRYSFTTYGKGPHAIHVSKVPGLELYDSVIEILPDVYPYYSFGNNFGYTEKNVSDLSIEYSSSTIRPGFNSKGQLKLENVGSKTARNIIIELSADTLIEFIETDSSEWLVINKDSLVLELALLGGNKEKVFTIPQYLLPGADKLGEKICFTYKVNQEFETSLSKNDTGEFCTTVVGSYDPNHKEITKGNGRIDTTTKNFTYFVQFQNTGSDTAFNITVVDSLDTNFYDFNKFKILDASHYYEMEFNNGIATWSFPNILLVDSNTNEPLSHGSFYFEIGLKDNFTWGDSIKNFVDIYFDYNEPVRTNTAINYWVKKEVEKEEGSNGNNSVAIIDVGNLFYYPNPISDFVNVQFESIESFQTFIEVYNEVGQLVFSQLQKIAKGENQFQLNLEGLESGVYLVSVSGTWVSFSVTVK